MSVTISLCPNIVQKCADTYVLRITTLQNKHYHIIDNTDGVVSLSIQRRDTTFFKMRINCIRIKNNYIFFLAWIRSEGEIISIIHSNISLSRYCYIIFTWEIFPVNIPYVVWWMETRNLLVQTRLQVVWYGGKIDQSLEGQLLSLRSKTKVGQVCVALYTEFCPGLIAWHFPLEVTPRTAPYVLQPCFVNPESTSTTVYTHRKTVFRMLWEYA